MPPIVVLKEQAGHSWSEGRRARLTRAHTLTEGGAGAAVKV
jgi:hypothetical protein